MFCSASAQREKNLARLSCSREEKRGAARREGRRELGGGVDFSGEKNKTQILSVEAG